MKKRIAMLQWLMVAIMLFFGGFAVESLIKSFEYPLGIYLITCTAMVLLVILEICRFRVEK
ncbi:MAG: hypothetical protein H6607_00940 [Flavobacteriales bacterium]|nr:hypothetical protein [Flavobacteriales bacterium]